ncbi:MULTISPECIES: undecaprenyl-diphosphate phosphatase [unclassified Acidisoma]|jgi:undecaprenyl-diphosphatase|uniref:undecaprenyl-diphosphate phosphatase n=1 Tax=unclassified Acidisoma TaxID=2634065 RepID=UPI00131AAD13|nr:MULTISPECIES: undecaprenyl-diphosphate phosphatase [unclassified Acidisoma]
MDPLHAIIIALVQGATELFPVSSLGHAVVLPALLGWHLDLQSSGFLPFLVMLHVGTAVALLVFFWRDWLAIIRALLGMSDAHANKEGRRVFALIIISMIPVVVIGLVLEHPLRRVFATPLIAAVFLVVNGLILLVGERMKGSGSRALSTLTAKDALIIGLWQCLALVPGISRSGVTILGGVLRGVDHEGSAHFSFLIATPVIGAAAVLEIPKLLHDPALHGSGVFQLSLICAVVAGLTALASTAFLMRYFRGHDRSALDPYAWYCVAAGLGSAAFLLFR